MRILRYCVIWQDETLRMYRDEEDRASWRGYRSVLEHSTRDGAEMAGRCRRKRRPVIVSPEAAQHSLPMRDHLRILESNAKETV